MPKVTVEIVVVAMALVPTAQIFMLNSSNKKLTYQTQPYKT